MNRAAGTRLADCGRVARAAHHATRMPTRWFRPILLLVLSLAPLRISALSVNATTTSTPTASPSVRSVRGRKPNVIIFFADDLGVGDLGIFGHPTSSTPSINTFVMEGAKLTQYYSAAAICSPSRAALMTGRLFGRAGIWPGVLSPLSIGGLPLTEITVAKALKTAGYTTGVRRRRRTAAVVGEAVCDAVLWCLCVVLVVLVADGGSPAGALVGEAGVGPGAVRCGAVRCGAVRCRGFASLSVLCDAGQQC